MWYKKELPSEINNRDLDKLTANIGHSYSDMNLVGQYENTVDILINQIIEEKHRVDTISHPLLYLMRHSIELGLKENIKYLKKYSKLPILKSKTHTLSDLFLEFEKHYKKIAIENNFEIELKEEYNKYTSDLKDVITALGEDASSFRYVYATDGKKIFENSKTINVYELKKKYDNSLVFITYTADVISPYTDYIDYLKFDKSIKDNSIGIVRYCFDKSQKDWLIEKLNEKYKILIGKSVWYDEDEKYYLHLKIANKKILTKMPHLWCSTFLDCFFLPIFCRSATFFLVKSSTFI